MILPTKVTFGLNTSTLPNTVLFAKIPFIDKPIMISDEWNVQLFTSNGHEIESE